LLNITHFEWINPDIQWAGTQYLFTINLFTLCTHDQTVEQFPLQELITIQ